MNTIIQDLIELKTDKPNFVITEDIIKEYIEENIDELIKDIKEELTCRN
jgi:hypothetical protein